MQANFLHRFLLLKVDVSLNILSNSSLVSATADRRSMTTLYLTTETQETLNLLFLCFHEKTKTLKEQDQQKGQTRNRDYRGEIISLTRKLLRSKKRRKIR